MDFGSLAQLAIGVGKAGTGIASLFNNDSTDPYRTPGFMQSLAAAQEALNASHAAKVYAGAAADPNSPYFKNIADSEHEKDRLSLIDSIRRIMMQNNIAAGKGVAPVGINPERRDENVYKTLMRGFMDSRISSRDRARQFLLNASQASAGAAGAAGNASRAFAYPTALASQMQQKQTGNHASGYNALFDTFGQVVKKLQGLGGSAPGAGGDSGGPDWWSTAGGGGSSNSISAWNGVKDWL